jgi:hypothetical protein
MQFEVPERMSQRRAEAISGIRRATIAAAIPVAGEYGQVDKIALEALMGRPILWSDWEKATIDLGRKAMARQQDAA